MKDKLKTIEMNSDEEKGLIYPHEGVMQNEDEEDKEEEKI